MSRRNKTNLKKPIAQVGTTIQATFTRDLPPEFLQLIGSVMVNWAFLEMRLQEFVFRALGLSDQQGRLAVKNLRAKEMAALTIELCALRKLPPILKADLEAINTLEARRNQLAHSVWLVRDEKFILRDLTGSTNVDGKKVSRKVKPAGIPMTLESLHNLSEQIEKAIQSTQDAMQALHILLSSSPQTHP